MYHGCDAMRCNKKTRLFASFRVLAILGYGMSQYHDEIQKWSLFMEAKHEYQVTGRVSHALASCTAMPTTSFFVLQHVLSSRVIVCANRFSNRIRSISKRRGSPSPGPPSNPSMGFSNLPNFSFDSSAPAPLASPQAQSTNPFAFGGQPSPALSFPPTNGSAASGVMSPTKSFGGFGTGAFGSQAGADVNGASANNGGGGFGSNAFSFGASQPSTASNPFASVQAPSSSFTFGATPTPATSQPSQSFSFGQTASASSAPAQNSAGASTTPFSFGQSVSSTPVFDALQAASTPNGVSNASTEPANTTSNLFGSKFAPTAANNSFSTPSFSFGATSATTSTQAPSQPATTPSKPTFSFGSTTPAASPAKLFGNDSNPTPKASFSFGSTTPAAEPSKPSAPATASVPTLSFGAFTPAKAAVEAPVVEASTTQKPSFTFGNANTKSTAAPTTTSSGIFGAPPASTAGALPSSNIFNLAKETPAQPTPAPQPVVPAKTPNFGAFTPAQSSSTTASAAVAQPQPPTSNQSNNLATSKFASFAPSSSKNTNASKPREAQISEQLRNRVMAEEAVTYPTNIRVEAHAQWWRDAKMFKLNDQVRQAFTYLQAGKHALFKDFTPLFQAYQTLAKEIQEEYAARESKSGGGSKNNPVKETISASATQPRSSIGPSTPSKFATQNSSDTAKKFGSFLSTSPAVGGQSSTPQASPAKDNSSFKAGSTPFKPAANANPGSTPFKATTESQLNSFAGTTVAKPSIGASSSGFKPTFGSSTNAAASAPAFGFKPNLAAPSGTNFMSQFGENAKKSFESEMKKEKAKRKAEEFDSDEDDPVEWEKKWEAEQELKRKKIEDARKLAPPTFSGSNTPGTSRSVSPAGSVLDGPKPAPVSFFNNIPADAAAKDDDDSDDESSKKVTFTGATAKSLADRITHDASNASSRSQNGSTDQTWNPASPIKFGTMNGANNSTANGTSTSNPFGSLNPKAATGPNANKSSLFAPASATPSTLTTADTSRASTPIESEAPSANGDQEGEDTTAPGNDLVKWEASVVGHDVLFENPKATAHKYINGGWIMQGTGPMAVLKNTETGVPSILMKASPSGKIVINTRLSSSVKYDAQKKRVRFAIAVTKDEGPSLESWIVGAGSEEKAKEMAAICEKEKA